MVPTPKQQELIDSLKSADSAWSEFDSNRIAQVLESHLDAWEWGYWNPSHDSTILLVPSDPYKCHIVGEWADADEIDEYFTNEALHILFGMDTSYRKDEAGYNEALAVFDGIDNVIRLWWD